MQTFHTHTHTHTQTQTERLITTGVPHTLTTPSNCTRTPYPRLTHPCPCPCRHDSSHSVHHNIASTRPLPHRPHRLIHHPRRPSSFSRIHPCCKALSLLVFRVFLAHHVHLSTAFHHATRRANRLYRTPDLHRPPPLSPKQRRTYSKSSNTERRTYSKSSKRKRRRRAEVELVW